MKSNCHAALQFVKSKAIAMQYPTFRLKDDEDKFLSILRFVEKILPDRVIIVCQRSEDPHVQYVSENSKKVFGYDATVMMQMTVQEFLGLVHPEDTEGVHQCFAFINTSEPYDPLLYRFELHYRIQNKNGNFMHIRDEKMVIMDNDKYIYLNTFEDLTDREKFHDVKLNIYQSIRGDFKKINTYYPRQNSGFITPRQKDIVKLITKGFTNQEIAHQLSLSINTIKNHKNLLFRKLNVKSSIELASIAGELRAV